MNRELFLQELKNTFTDDNSWKLISNTERMISYKMRSVSGKKLIKVIASRVFHPSGQVKRHHLFLESEVAIPNWHETVINYSREHTCDLEEMNAHYLKFVENFHAIVEITCK